MSGGHFDYMQYRITDIADGIDNLIAHNQSADCTQNEDEDELYSFRYKFSNDRYKFSNETIAKFQQAAACLKRAAIMAHRIDWLVSGDDSEESFHQYWAEELGEIDK